MGAVPAAMRMEQRGFKLDVEAHARLIADLSAERIAAEQEYREACRASGHAALADKVAIDASAEGGHARRPALERRARSAGAGRRNRGRSRPGAANLLRAGHYPPIRGVGEALAVSTRCCPRSGRRWRRWCRPSPAGFTRTIGSPARRRAAPAAPVQICSKFPRDPRFRALFVPEPGYVFVVADYSSMELRAAAYISGDHAMTTAFEQGLDLHRMTAARMTGKDPAEVTERRAERREVREFRFDLRPGRRRPRPEPHGINSTLVLDFDEAKAWLKAFESAYSRLRAVAPRSLPAL